MNPPELPGPDAKSGLKIDYVAKRLALLLLPLGFKRKARQFVRAAGSGNGAHWQIVQLQAGKWNEGPRGSFHVNLALQFPALARLLAQRAGQEWLAQEPDEADERRAQLHERLGHLQSELPADHPCALPAHSDEVKFGRGSDLAALADGVLRAAGEIGLPWLERHASLRALADFEGSLLSADAEVRIGAAVLLGDPPRAQQILVEQRGRFENSTPTYLAHLRSWCAGFGLDVSALPAEVAPVAPSAWEQRREAAQRAEEAQHRQRAEAVRAQAAQAAPAAPLPPAALAEAWLAEHQAQWRSDPAPLADLPSGRDIAALPAAGREAVLCALLQHLVLREQQQAGLRLRADPPAEHFEPDESVKALLAALLPTLPAAAEGTVLTVLGQLRALLTRWQQELVTGGYPWGFALLVRWLAGPAGAAHRAALQPAIAGWLEAFAAFALARHERLLARVAADQAAAEDPAHPMHEMLREAREREAELAARQPPPSAEQVRQRIAEYPEQGLCGADKQAVATLRRELRRDAATGRLPVAWDGDDWGRAAQAAWQALPDALREALTPVLQGWLEGVDTRPSKTWLRTLQAQLSGLPAAQAGPWRRWVLQQLAAFEHSSGQAQWATTGARPGFGARLGEASEHLLLGLLWWAWHDPALDAAALDEALQRTSTGAWQRLPDVGARAPTAGGLVLRMAAGLGDAPRQRVAALGAAPGAPKQLKQAVERALKEPLGR